MAAAKQGTGLKKETAAILATILGPTLIVPLILLFVEKNPFVRFHAMQSVTVFVILWALNSILWFPLGGLIGLAIFLFWLLLTYKAWQGVEWEVPVIGKLSRQVLSKL